MLAVSSCSKRTIWPPQDYVYTCMYVRVWSLTTVAWGFKQLGRASGGMASINNALMSSACNRQRDRRVVYALYAWFSTWNEHCLLGLFHTIFLHTKSNPASHLLHWLGTCTWTGYTIVFCLFSNFIPTLRLLVFASLCVQWLERLPKRTTKCIIHLTPTKWMVGPGTCFEKLSQN